MRPPRGRVAAVWAAPPPGPAAPHAASAGLASAGPGKDWGRRRCCEEDRDWDQGLYRGWSRSWAPGAAREAGRGLPVAARRLAGAEPPREGAAQRSRRLRPERGRSLSFGLVLSARGGPVFGGQGDLCLSRLGSVFAGPYWTT